MSNIIQQLEAEQMNREVPDFTPGDTVVVQVKVKEGNRERLQAFEGVVIAKRNRGLNSAFTVRKISHGEGVERVFQTYSPTVAEIQVKRRGAVRRAKLYYLRGRTGKAPASRKTSSNSGGLESHEESASGNRGAFFFACVDGPPEDVVKEYRHAWFTDAEGFPGLFPDEPAAGRDAAGPCRPGGG